MCMFFKRLQFNMTTMVFVEDIMCTIIHAQWKFL